MSEKIKNIASRSPPINNIIEPILHLLEYHIRKPLEGTWFDRWIATPAKKYYIISKRRD
tara:strand:- start:230 stop:406 length:177 start_codon:yes stop_codon:yes gene_type:complete